MVIAYYLRLSMADGDLGKGNKDESNSIENQRALIQNFVDEMDELQGEVKEYVDDGYTGTNFERPGFQQMIEDAKAGLINVIIVKDLSRLGRDYIGVGDYLEQIFPILGIRVIAINSNYDSNNYLGKTMGLDMSISNLINSLYSRDLSKKSRSTFRTKWKEGVSTCGRVPFGYKKGKSKRWVLDPLAASYVRMIFDKALEGWSTSMIANFLNEQDIPTPGRYHELYDGKRCYNRKVSEKEWLWDNRKVWCILKTYEYTGALAQGKSIGVVIGSTTRRKVDRSKWYVTENVNPAIVTREEFEDAQIVIQSYGTKGYSKDAGFSLRSKITCGNCGLRMNYADGVEPLVFCTHTVAAGSKSTCDKTRHSAKKIEGIVYAALKNNLEILYRLGGELQTKKDNETVGLMKRQKEAERKLEYLQAERVRQYEDYASGVIERDAYIEKKKKLNESIELMQKEYERLKIINSTEDELSSEVEAVQEAVEELMIFKTLTREAVEAFIEMVYIYDSQKIEIKFVFEDLIQELIAYLDERKGETA